MNLLSSRVLGAVVWVACLQACGPSGLVTGDGSPATGGVANVGGTPGDGSGAQAGQSGGASSGGAPSAGSGGQAASGGQNGSGGSAGGLPVGEDPTAGEAAQAMGRGVNLGQVFESTQHPRTLVAASAKIDAYYARGFRTLRIPITWTEVIDGDLLVTDATTGEVNREHPRL